MFDTLVEKHKMQFFTDMYKKKKNIRFGVCGYVFVSDREKEIV